MSDQDKKEQTYYFGEVSKIEIKENDIVDVFAYMFTPSPGGGFVPGGGGRTPVMVGPGGGGFNPGIGVKVNVVTY